MQISSAGLHSRMPRQVRIEFEGAIYHVMCRGDRREPIFADDTDRRTFLRTLAESVARCGWLVHAFVLMGNHYHLLLETPEANLVRGMTWFQTTYTVRFNARHRLVGHLFGGRYKAVLVESDERDYFRTLIDYIHLNPVRAGLVKTDADGAPDVAGFEWSSLPQYRARPSLRPEFLETSRGFGVSGLKDGIRGRREFVVRLARRAELEKAEECGLAEIAGQGLQSTLRRGWCYGSEAFKERMLEKAEELLQRRSSPSKKSKNYAGEEIRDHGVRRAERIARCGLEVFGLGEEDLPNIPKDADEKALTALLIRGETTVPLAWIAERLGMGSTSTVTRASIAIGERLKKDRALKSARKKIIARIVS